jgi:hypothetical protein
MEEKHSRKQIWVVLPTEASGRIGIYAGDREIHVLPAAKMPKHHYFAYLRFQEDPLREINPRQLLTPDSLRLIQMVHPRAIGIEILICGWAVFLFKTKKDLISSWGEGAPDTIGGLPVGYLTLDDSPTKASLVSGASLADSIDRYTPNSQLGLKIKLLDNTVAITVVTHGFVKLPQYKLVTCFIADSFKKIKKSILKFRPVLNPAVVHAEVNTKDQKRGNSPLGKAVYLAGTSVEASSPQVNIPPSKADKLNLKIGRQITQTFDNPSKHLPYPAGYKHGLSLVTSTSVDLPEVIIPLPGVSALSGKPVFATSFFLHLDRWKTIEGTIAADKVHSALVEGARYSWEKNSLYPPVAILWRTNQDGDDARGFSGSVLCLGSPLGGKVKPVVFQNFERIIQPWAWPVGTPKKAHGPRDTIKAGFLLPDTIKKSQILLQSGGEKRSFSGPAGVAPVLPGNARKEFSDFV